MKLLSNLIFITCLLVLIACENEKNTFMDQPSIYIKGDPDQQATADSVLFSFKKSDKTVETYDLNVVIYTTGVVSENPRTFDLEVVSSGTNVTSDDYSIGKMELLAGAYYATVPITVNRTVGGLDLTQEIATLTLRVKANENFEVGAEEYMQFKLCWCDYLIQPAWWTLYGFTFDAGPFTQARYQFILDYYGDVDLFEMGIVDPITGYAADYNKQYAFIAELIELLNEYNATHEEPYLNDNGEPLEFGSGLTY